MPARFVDLDRQTPMFLPYDLREWTPADHIVHCMLDHDSICTCRAANRRAFEAAFVRVAANDRNELPSTVAAICPVVARQVKTILSDRGSYRDAAVQAVEQNPNGTPIGVTVFAAVEKSGRNKTVAGLLPQPEPSAPEPEATHRELMAHRRKKVLAKMLCKLRTQTMEPVFGIIKAVMGFRRFSLRGLEKARSSGPWSA